MAKIHTNPTNFRRVHLHRLSKFRNIVLPVWLGSNCSIENRHRAGGKPAFTLNGVVNLRPNSQPKCASTGLNQKPACQPKCASTG